MRTVLRAALVLMALQGWGIVPLLSQDPPTETKIPHRVPRAASPIKVDGILDEPAWGAALELSIPWEVWPSDNVEAMVSTQALGMWPMMLAWAAAGWSLWHSEPQTVPDADARPVTA